MRSLNKVWKISAIGLFLVTLQSSCLADYNKENMDVSPNFLYLTSRDSLLRLEVSSIVYFAADGNYTYIVCANKMKYTVGMTLAKMQCALMGSLGEKASWFVRIGKSHIVSMRYINKIDVPRQTLLLSDGRSFVFRLDVSKEALRKLKDLLVMSNK